jgi:hypothetical protein
MLDYSLLENAAGALIEVPVVRGYAWPAGGRTFALRLIRDDGWNNGEDALTWRLLFDNRMAGGAALASATASAAAISGPSNQYLDLSFALSAADSTALAGAGQATMLVDLESEDSQQKKDLWPEAHGKIAVRSAVGGGA